MTSIYLALAALALAAIPVALLCVGDPKRRRAAGEPGGMSSGRRWLLVIATIMPGLACALLGESAAFMLWLGGIALAGWGLAAALARNEDKPAA